MRIPRFYLDQPIECNTQLTLPEALHRHAVQVLRSKIGDPIILFNGRGGEFSARFEVVEKRRSEVAIETFDAVNRESALDLRVLIALIKPDKFDFAVQKAVELGVHSIQPLITQRSVINLKASRLEKKMLHWQGVIVNACEQSGRTRVPELLQPITLTDYLQSPAERARISMLPEAEDALLIDKVTTQQCIDLLVGPEGGFTDEEVGEMKRGHVYSMQLGARVLRAETAVIGGVTACQMYWGDFGSSQIG